MPDAWHALLRRCVHSPQDSPGVINTISPRSVLNDAIGHRKTLRQQRSSPLFVAGALDPPLFRCPTKASVPRGCEVENRKRRATPDRRFRTTGRAPRAHAIPRTRGAAQFFMALSERVLPSVMARLGLAIHEFRCARLSGGRETRGSQGQAPSAKADIRRRGMTEWGG